MGGAGRPSFLWGSGGWQFQALPDEGVAYLWIPGQQVYCLLPQRLAHDAPVGMLIGKPVPVLARAGHSVELEDGVEPLAEWTGPTGLQAGWDCAAECDLGSGQEVSRLVRESFLEAALVPRCGPDICNSGQQEPQML